MLHGIMEPVRNLIKENVNIIYGSDPYIGIKWFRLIRAKMYMVVVRI